MINKELDNFILACESYMINDNEFAMEGIFDKFNKLGKKSEKPVDNNQLIINNNKKVENELLTKYPDLCKKELEERRKLIPKYINEAVKFIQHEGSNLYPDFRDFLTNHRYKYDKSILSNYSFILAFFDVYDYIESMTNGGKITDEYLVEIMNKHSSELIKLGDALHKKFFRKKSSIV